MQEAWWQPQVMVPDDYTDGAPRGRSLTSERSTPGCIIVNRKGVRFVNETHNYNDVMKAFHTYDPSTYGPANLPAYMVFDQRYVERYGFKGHEDGAEPPAWLPSAETLRELGELVGVDADALVATVHRFNAHAHDGVDPDFHRGESAYERYWGDQLAPHPNLAPLEQPPFYAAQVLSGVIGTKGGIATTTDGQARDAFDGPIPGLYALGNTSAHPMGPGYPGGGGTLGPAMTLAVLAGRHCLDAKRAVSA
jgi:hypothetical protein